MMKMSILDFSSTVLKNPDNGDEPKNSNFEHNNAINQTGCYI